MSDTKLRPTNTMKSKDKSSERFSAMWTSQIAIHIWLSLSLNKLLNLWKKLKLRLWRIFRFTTPKNLGFWKPTSTALVISARRVQRLLMQVIVNLHSAHMDPDDWQQPQQFRPERFLDESGSVVGREIASYLSHSVPYVDRCWWILTLWLRLRFDGRSTAYQRSLRS